MIIALVVALWLRRTRVPLLVTALYLVITMSTIFVNAHAIYFDLGDPDRGVRALPVFGLDHARHCGRCRLAPAATHPEAGRARRGRRTRRPRAARGEFRDGVLAGRPSVAAVLAVARRALGAPNWRADSEWYGAVPHWLDVTLMGVGAVACVLACVAVTKLALAAPRVGADAETEER